MIGIHRLLSLVALLGSTFAVASARAEQYAEINTTQGTILLELDDQKAPITVANFEKYAKDGFYAGTVFHRVIPDFMIQGGGFDHHGNYPAGLHNKAAHAKMQPPIKNEWTNGLPNVRGSISMARLGGQPDSATSQFFINLKDNDFLDQPRDGAGYAVFGKVVAGMDVVERIGNMKTRTIAGMQNVPNVEVRIESVKMLSKDEAEKRGEGIRRESAEQRVKAAEAALKAAQAELAAAQKALQEAGGSGEGS